MMENEIIKFTTQLEDMLEKDPVLKKKLVESALGVNPDTGEINPNFIYEDYTSESDTDYEPETEVSESETEDDTVEEDTEHIKQSNIITTSTTRS